MTLNATASQTDHQGWSPTGFSGGPVSHYQGNQAVDVWSNHACSGGSVNSFLPGLRKCTPWQRQWHQGREGEPTGIISKATKDQSSGCYWKRQGVHPKLEGTVGPSFFKGPVIFPVLNDSQSQSRGESSKGQACQARRRTTQVAQNGLRGREFLASTKKTVE